MPILRAIYRRVSTCSTDNGRQEPYLSEPLRLGVLLETEGGKVTSISKHLGLCEDAHASHSINLHLHVGIAIWVAQVGQVGSPGRILGISLDNDGILIQRVG